MNTQVNLYQQTRDDINYKAGDVIFMQGELAANAFVVQSGVVDLYMNGRHIETLSAGDIFGERDMMNGSMYQTTAIAQTDTSIIAVDDHRFKYLLENTPAFAMNVMRMLSARLAAANKLAAAVQIY